MRRSDHPSRPSAMTCCFFSSLKTLLTLTEGNPHVMLHVLGSTPLAGFHVILIGRLWVIPEGLFTIRHSADARIPRHIYAQRATAQRGKLDAASRLSPATITPS